MVSEPIESEHSIYAQYTTLTQNDAIKKIQTQNKVKLILYPITYKPNNKLEKKTIGSTKVSITTYKTCTPSFIVTKKHSCTFSTLLTKKLTTFSMVNFYTLLFYRFFKDTDCVTENYPKLTLYIYN